jgi:hypothetical protein
LDGCGITPIKLQDEVVTGSETLSPIVVGPCEPGQTLTGAALSIVFSGACGDSVSLPVLLRSEVSALAFQNSGLGTQILEAPLRVFGKRCIGFS